MSPAGISNSIHKPTLQINSDHLNGAGDKYSAESMMHEPLA